MEIKRYDKDELQSEAGLKVTKYNGAGSQSKVSFGLQSDTVQMWCLK